MQQRLIDLAQNRRLAISRGGWRGSLIVAPISECAWFEHFYDKIYANSGHGVRAEIGAEDVEFAGLNLLKEVAASAEGYPHLTGMADWLSKIPAAHMSTYGNELLEVFENREPLEPAAAPVDRICVVRMEALWGAMSADVMRRHKHLIHEFERPSKQQRERYRGATIQMLRTPGLARSGPAVTARGLAALYDELILKVDGYAVNGEPLTDDREKIVANMDTFHKVNATRWLFSRGRSGAEWRRAA